MHRVTELLQRAGLRGDMPFMSEQDKAWYMQRGSMIHKATTLVDTEELDWEALDPRIVGHVRAYLAFIAEVCPVIIETEQEVVSKEYGYIGHLDRVFRIGKRVVLCDIKTSQVDIVTRLQTVAYQIARCNRYIARMGLALRANGTYACTWWTERDKWNVDKEGWLNGVLPNDQEQVRKWKQRVGMKETT